MWKKKQKQADYRIRTKCEEVAAGAVSCFVLLCFPLMALPRVSVLGIEPFGGTRAKLKTES